MPQHMRFRGPVFVPIEHQAEVLGLSKAALADMAWDYARQMAGGEHPETMIIDEFRARAEIVLTHRKQAARMSS